MSVILTCEKCGAENRLGALFCRECGAKLDLSKLQTGPSTGGRPRRSGGSGSSWGIARIIRLLILLVLLAVLGMLCWPAPMTGDAPSPQGAQLVTGKMTALRGAIVRRNDASDRFEEADINAYLNKALVNPATPEGFHLSLNEINIDIRPDVLEVVIKSKLGPIAITYSAPVSMTRLTDGRHVFTAGDVRIGRFPALGPLRERTVRQMAGIFVRLPEEFALLNRLPRVAQVDGAIEVSTTANQP